VCSSDLAFAIIVPDTIVEFLVIFIGVFLIIAGLYLLSTLIRPKPKSEDPARKLEGKDLLLVLVLLALALLIVIMMILLGVSMLIENLVPGIFIVIILVCFGLIQFALLYVQSIVERKHLLG
jgi:O-antigen/teichoic acid export membrane protein